MFRSRSDATFTPRQQPRNMSAIRIGSVRFSIPEGQTASEHRSVREVRLIEPFKKPPVVFLSVTGLERTGERLGYQVRAQNVTRMGFEVELVLAKGLLGADVEVQWLAVDGRHATVSVVRPVIG
ncbi:MAG: H-type lectin domain-containing protein [Flavobacteriales bacterium]|nr:H-type lectin domain-containing protein [Flavobacteriales bacterium]